jgi:hypothetical protein
MIVFAATGFFWLVILLWLAGSNFLMRPQFPPPADLFSETSVLRNFFWNYWGAVTFRCCETYSALLPVCCIAAGGLF